MEQTKQDLYFEFEGMLRDEAKAGGRHVKELLERRTIQELFEASSWTDEGYDHKLKVRTPWRLELCPEIKSALDADRQERELTDKTIKPITPVVGSPAPTEFNRLFTKRSILNSGLANWVQGIVSRINPKSGVRKPGGEAVALLDHRERSVAIRDSKGFAIPSPKDLNEDQLKFIIDEADPGRVGIEVKGSQDFCERVENACTASGLKCTHEFQVSDAERSAAAQRVEAAERMAAAARGSDMAPR